MARKDDYYNRAKQQGYRARSAYKLRQLDETANLLDEGDTVIDLGAAPGGWLQIARELVGESGTIIGIDRQEIEPIDGVETVRGDLTDEETVAELRERITETDVVLSDMAPNMSGQYDLDHARSVYLARIAFDLACDLLVPGGDLAVKVFDGRDREALEADIENAFEYVRTVRPEASRDESSELYLVGKGRLTTELRPGDVRTVEITDTGNEGDGIAKVDGYTVFVPDAEVGDTPRVRIEDVKPRFGFAERT